MPFGPIRMVISEQDPADSAALRILSASSANRLTLYISLRAARILGIRPNQPFRHKSRLLPTLHFDHHTPGKLDPALEIFNRIQREPSPNPAPRRHRARKPQTIEPVIDPHLEIARDLDRFPHQPADQRN